MVLTIYILIHLLFFLLQYEVCSFEFLGFLNLIFLIDLVTHFYLKRTSFPAQYGFKFYFLGTVFVLSWAMLLAYGFLYAVLVIIDMFLDFIFGGLGPSFFIINLQQCQRISLFFIVDNAYSLLLDGFVYNLILKVASF
jgi:hypothetical protein